MLCLWQIVYLGMGVHDDPFSDTASIKNAKLLKGIWYKRQLEERNTTQNAKCVLKLYSIVVYVEQRWGESQIIVAGPIAMALRQCQIGQAIEECATPLSRVGWGVEEVAK